MTCDKVMSDKLSWDHAHVLSGIVGRESASSAGSDVAGADLEYEFIYSISEYGDDDRLLYDIETYPTGERGGLDSTERLTNSNNSTVSGHPTGERSLEATEDVANDNVPNKCRNGKHRHFSRTNSTGHGSRECRCIEDERKNKAQDSTCTKTCRHRRVSEQSKVSTVSFDDSAFKVRKQSKAECLEVEHDMVASMGLRCTSAKKDRNDQNTSKGDYSRKGSRSRRVTSASTYGSDRMIGGNGREGSPGGRSHSSISANKSRLHSATSFGTTSSSDVGRSGSSQEDKNKKEFEDSRARRQSVTFDPAVDKASAFLHGGGKNFSRANTSVTPIRYGLKHLQMNYTESNLENNDSVIFLDLLKQSNQKNYIRGTAIRNIETRLEAKRKNPHYFTSFYEHKRLPDPLGRDLEKKKTARSVAQKKLERKKKIKSQTDEMLTGYVPTVLTMKIAEREEVEDIGRKCRYLRCKIPPPLPGKVVRTLPVKPV